DDPKHVIYVWMDALANYITALGYGSDDTKLFEKFWPANLQMIGKEIVRFHCVYWPAFLMAAGLPLPQRIHAHGWLLFEENKMSKSRGNIVRAETIVDVLGADALRYFLLREVVFGQDGSFSFDALVQRYNADLANGLGNLASRTLTMITRYFRGEAPRIVTALAHPVIPEATTKIWAQLGLGELKKYPLQELHWGQLHLGTKLGKIEPVFPRADKSAVERMQRIEDEGRTAAAPET